MTKLELSVFYDLQSSQDVGLPILDQTLTDFLFFFTEQSFDRLVTMLHNDKVREKLWPKIRPYLQENVRDMEPEVLIGNPLFTSVMLLQAKLNLWDNAVFESPSRNVRAHGFTFGGSVGP